MRLIIRGGRLVDPAPGIDGPRDLFLENGEVAEVLEPGASLPGWEGVEEIAAQGLCVIPGLVDIHVHLREPGYEYKETILSGSRAAVAGGVTSLCCMPNTKPVNDCAAVALQIQDRAQEAGLVRLYPIGALSKGSEGEELSEMAELVEAGCVAVSDDGRPVANTALFRRAMEYARIFPIPVVDHCEDPHLAQGGCMHEGFVSTRLGLRGIPAAAEEVQVARDIALAELTGAHLHVAHVSTSGAVRLIREAKSRGVRVTAETCPHYFLLTDEAVNDYDTHAKMNPPLQGAGDRDAVRAGLADGTLDAICTDHAPHHPSEKHVPFEEAPFGIVGLETLLPLSLRLWHEGAQALPELLHLLTWGPAQIMGLPGGRLQPGDPADVVLVDLDREWRIQAERFASKGRNTPFDDWTVRGRVVRTLLGGRTVYQAEGRVPWWAG